MDTPAITAKMTAGTLGGMIGPMIDEAPVIARLKSSSYPPSLIAWNSRLPQTAGVRDGRARHAGEDHTRQDVGVAQPTGEMADDVVGEVEERR